MLEKTTRDIIAEGLKSDISSVELRKGFEESAYLQQRWVLYKDYADVLIIRRNHKNIRSALRCHHCRIRIEQILGLKFS